MYIYIYIHIILIIIIFILYIYNYYTLKYYTFAQPLTFAHAWYIFMDFYPSTKLNTVRNLYRLDHGAFVQRQNMAVHKYNTVKIA